LAERKNHLHSLKRQIPPIGWKDKTLRGKTNPSHWLKGQNLLLSERISEARTIGLP
jgi:hypothetical protein